MGNTSWSCGRGTQHNAAGQDLAQPGSALELQVNSLLCELICNAKTLTKSVLEVIHQFERVLALVLVQQLGAQLQATWP